MAAPPAAAKLDLTALSLPRLNQPRVSWLRGARVDQWAHFMLLPLASLDPTVGLAMAALGVVRGVVTAFALLAFGYLLNGVADRQMDRNARKNPLVAGEPGASHASALAALAVLAIGSSLPAPRAVVAATLICFFSGVAYSVGPRLKRYPVFGTVVNATNFAPLLWLGFVRTEAIAGMVQLTAAFVCLLLQNQLFHEAADREEDQRGAVRTSVLVFGSRRAAVVAALLGVGLVVTFALGRRAPVMTLPLALVYVAAFPAALWRRGDDAALMGRARVVHRWCCVLTGALLFACLRPQVLGLRYADTLWLAGP